MLNLSQLLLGELNDLGESGGIVDGHLGEDLTVQIDIGEL